VLIEAVELANARVGDQPPGRAIRYLRTLAWAVASVRRVRRHLRSGGLASVTVVSAPPGGRGARRGLRDGLRLTGPSCLERSLVRRAWNLRQGVEIPIVIGIRGSGSGSGERFGAHAWLQGDPPDPGGFAELLVWPHT